jgi:hypothetical protein
VVCFGEIIGVTDEIQGVAEMSVVGALLKNRRAGEGKLAWNLVSGPVLAKGRLTGLYER